MKERKFITDNGKNYYIEPLDSNTNLYISCQLREEDGCEVKNAIGKKLKVWKCDTDFMLKLERSRKRDNLKFKIYRQDESGLKRILNAEK